MTLIAVLGCLVAAGAVGWLVAGYVADKVGDAEWRKIDEARWAPGASVVSALRRDIYRRSGLL